MTKKDDGKKQVKTKRNQLKMNKGNLEKNVHVPVGRSYVISRKFAPYLAFTIQKGYPKDSMKKTNEDPKVNTIKNVHGSRSPKARYKKRVRSA